MGKREDQAVYEKRQATAARRLALLMVLLDDAMSTVDRWGVQVTHVTMKAAAYSSEEVMVILKGRSGDDKWVAFHTGDGTVAALKGALERADNGALKWREDKPWAG